MSPTMNDMDDESSRDFFGLAEHEDAMYQPEDEQADDYDDAMEEDTDGQHGGQHGDPQHGLWVLPASADLAVQDNGDNNHNAGDSHDHGPSDASAAVPATELFSAAYSDLSGSLGQRAEQLWLQPPLSESKNTFDIAAVEHIYRSDLVASGFALPPLMVLERLEFLEKYLLPNYPTAPAAPKAAHTMCIVLMLIEKFRLQRSDPWACFSQDQAKFGAVFGHVLQLILLPAGQRSQISLDEKRLLLVFLIRCFESLEVAFVRAECLKLVTIGIWHNLVNESARQSRLADAPERLALWERAEKRFNSAKAALKAKIMFERSFLSELIRQFYTVLDSIPESGQVPEHAIAYCERFIEFMIDLEAHLPTRRHVNELLIDHLLVPKCLASGLYRRSSRTQTTAQNDTVVISDTWGLASHQPGPLFKLLVDRLSDYEHFPIDDTTGNALSGDQVMERYYSRMRAVQKISFMKLPDHLSNFALASISNLEKEELDEIFDALDDDTLHRFCLEIGVRVSPFSKSDSSDFYSREFITSVLRRKFARPSLRVDKIAIAALYPTEISLFDESICPPNAIFGNTHCTVLPKMTLQFLTVQDALLRQFDLYKYHSFQQLRSFVQETVMRMSPAYNPAAQSDDKRTVFEGFSRNALAIDQFQISEVGPPMLTESRPSFIRGDLVYSVGKLPSDVCTEWDLIRPGDQLLLLSIQMEPVTDASLLRAAVTNLGAPGSGGLFRKRFGIKALRGCEVCELFGDNGRPIDDFISAQYARNFEERARVSRRQRYISVLFDANQYLLDTLLPNNRSSKGNIYDSFNLVIRLGRDANNIKAMLETIQDALRRDVALPEWLNDILLGYGDRHSAHYSQIETPVRSIDVGHTFSSWSHLVECFPNWTLTGSSDAEEQPRPPFVLTLPDNLFNGNYASETAATAVGSKRAAGVEHALESKLDVKVLPRRQVTVHDTDPVSNAINPVKFTPSQASAILSGSLPGLCLIASTPGSGEVAVAAQIAANIAHTHINERTLIVAPSKEQLVSLLSHTIQCGVDERFVLSLGHGFADLRADTDEALSKLGRINHLLARRAAHLARVDQLAADFGIAGAHGATCETAYYFFRDHVKPRWTQFENTALGGAESNAAHESQASSFSLDAIIKGFPFSAYFTSDGQTKASIFDGITTAENAAAKARALYRQIEQIFAELDETHALEILRARKDRANYIVTKQARVIGIVAQDAPLLRKELAHLGFHFENLIVASAHELFEIETFVPLLLSKNTTSQTDNGDFSLHRIVMVGDPTQLAPTVRSTALRSYSNFNQSMFVRLIKLGVPTVELNEQGRSRPSIASVYSPLYSPRVLMHHKDVANDNSMKLANPGFAFEYQMINVGDFMGQGETEPRTGFYQNLGEAEYVVAVFQYMRLLGYPSSKIVILTPYKGQKELIHDVLNQRCSWNPIFGSPRQIATVAEFRNQTAADHVLLSLTRTRTAGAVEDVSLLAAALTAARLGLYVFCRAAVYLSAVSGQLRAEPFRRLATRPTQLWLRVGEKYNFDKP
eukprot:jgi/Hompol1/5063/HPOL_001001-RA